MTLAKFLGLAQTVWDLSFKISWQELNPCTFQNLLSRKTQPIKNLYPNFDFGPIFHFRLDCIQSCYFKKY